MTILHALIIAFALLLGILLLACVLLPDVDSLSDIYEQVIEWLDREAYMQFDVILA